MKNNIDAIMLGDSLSARGDWEVLFYPKKIINLGHDGDTTRCLLNRVHLANEVNPKNIFLMIGINDMNLYLSLDEIFDNYKTIIKELEKTDSKIFIQAVLYTQMNSFNKKVKLFNELIKEFCQKENMEFIDLNEELAEADFLKSEYTSDGLHLNIPAYQVWAKKLKNYF